MPVLIILVLGMALLAVVQISGAVRSDPLYTDLKAFPAYAKNGFLASYAQIDDPDSLDWDLTLPPHSGRIIMSDLPGPEDGGRSGRFSAGNIEEFTIFIPFTLEKGTFQKLWGDTPSYPAFYFAGIGENWEIFLNGRSIARQIFLDEDGGVSEFRSVYGLSIPFSKEYLNEGDNSMVIRIIGARSGKWTGLRYTSPYYLGDSSYILNDFKGMSNTVLCAIFMFAGLYHLLIYMFRKDRYNLLFALFTVIASLYYFIKLPAAYSIFRNTAYIQRADYALLYLFVFMSAAFLETINIGKIPKVTLVYGIFSASMAALQWFFPIWFAYDLLQVWQFITVIFFAAYFISFSIIWRTYKAAIRLNEAAGSELGLWRGVYRHLFETEFGKVCVMLMIAGLTAIADIVNIMLFSINFSLTQYSYLGCVLMMAYIVAQKNSGRYETAAPGAGSREAVFERYGLTAREREIAAHLLTGIQVKNIPEAMGVSRSTVGFHSQNLYRKLGVQSRSELTALFAETVPEVTGAEEPDAKEP